RIENGGRNQIVSVAFHGGQQRGKWVLGHADVRIEHTEKRRGHLCKGLVVIGTEPLWLRIPDECHFPCQRIRTIDLLFSQVQRKENGRYCRAALQIPQKLIDQLPVTVTDNRNANHSKYHY